jgi:hypothetical protein
MSWLFFSNCQLPASQTSFAMAGGGAGFFFGAAGLANGKSTATRSGKITNLKIGLFFIGNDRPQNYQA